MLSVRLLLLVLLLVALELVLADKFLLPPGAEPVRDEPAPQPRVVYQLQQVASPTAYPAPASPVPIPVSFAAAAAAKAGELVVIDGNTYTLAPARAQPEPATVIATPNGYYVTPAPTGVQRTALTAVPAQGGAVYVVPAGQAQGSASSGVSDDVAVGESGNGWRIIFIVTLLVAGYIAIGCWYNRKTDNVHGLQAFPHIEFWMAVPGYVADGLSFSRSWVRASWARGFPVSPSEVQSSAEYEVIGQGRKGGYQPVGGGSSSSGAGGSDGFASSV